MALTIAQLTDNTTTGTGVFDVLMVAMKAHLVEEFQAGRITGQQYSTVYLGALSSVMDRSVEFLLNKDKTDLEAQMIAVQIEKLQVEKQLAEIQVDKAEKESQLIDAQIVLAQQQGTNLALEGTLIPKQGEKIDAEVELIEVQKSKLQNDSLLVQQNTLNAAVESTVLVAQECKLRAEFDLTQDTRLKTTAETSVLNQKKATEQAQISSAGIDPDSVIGKQIALVGRQADGFLRDAEQKFLQLMLSTWNTRRTTDENTVADSINQLSDASIGEAVSKAKAGIGI